MDKIIFWDWTGTLADESQLDKAVCRSIEEEIAEKESISPHEAEKAFKNYLKKLEDTWEWHDYVRHGKNFGIDWKAPQLRNLNNLILLPHAKEILMYAQDKGYRNILATNAVREVILLRLAHVGLSPFLETIIASDDVQALKSDGKHFEYGLKKLNGSPRNSFSIGNNPIQDIISAKKLNLRTVFCAFGEELTHYHSEHISNNYSKQVLPDYRIRDLSEIQEII